jgi:hypothetical protein
MCVRVCAECGFDPIHPHLRLAMRYVNQLLLPSCLIYFPADATTGETNMSVDFEGVDLGPILRDVSWSIGEMSKFVALADRHLECKPCSFNVLVKSGASPITPLLSDCI